jgi:diguanylate cyclase (GGDEF)-like protein
MARLRHVALLLASVLLICLTGALSIALTTQASDKAQTIHLQDRQDLQTTLGGLGRQYLLFSLKEALDYSGTGQWHLTPGDTADRVRLQTFVAHAVLNNYGAALVDTSGRLLSSYSQGPGLPPLGDPGYKPMVAALLAHRPDVSSVMTVGRLHVAAVGVPVTVAGTTKAIFVGFMRLDTSPLETYVRTLHFGRTGSDYVVDSSGVIAVATDTAKIGTRLVYGRALADIAHGRDANYLDTGGRHVVTDSPFGIGGWGGATVQRSSEFYGPLQSGHLRVEIAVVALLILAVLLVLLLNHKRESARRRFQAQLAYQAAHDGLTGLYNHSVFHGRLGEALSRARRTGRDVAVLYLDLDAFKPVNDTFGHERGDRVLEEMARRLQDLTRTEDVVARMGGDEFAILVEDVGSPSAVEALAQRIVDELSRPFAIDGAEGAVGVSVGIAYSRGGAGTAQDLIGQADLAMYQAKDADGGHYRWAPALEPVS